jgi:nucleoside-diphosphate-sugar epimerase
MKIFITGATGFIGAALTRRLLADGHQVHALVRSPSKAAPLSHPSLTLFQGDLSNIRAIGDAMAGCDSAFHLAAYAKVWARDPALYFDLNVLGTEAVMQAAADHGVKKIVITSTAGVWGPSLRGPISEARARDIDFLNEYESSKALADSRAKDYIIENGLDAVFVCPTRVYGPFLIGETGSITSLVERYLFSGWKIIPGRGDQIGNYVFVDDVVEGHIRALEKGARGRTYILGGVNASYNEFFRVLGEVSGLPRRMVHLPLLIQHIFTHLQLLGARWFGQEPVLTPSWMGKSLYHWEVDPSRMVSELGIQPTGLEEGLRKTVEWLRSRTDT